MAMKYFSEFVGSLIFLMGGYAYMCNVSLKNTLVAKLNYIELVVAWSLAVGFGLSTAVIMGGPALLNPGVAIGQLVIGAMPIDQVLMYILMEFLAAGAAVLLCTIFFWDSFKATGKDVSKRGIFSAYPVEKNIPLNCVQEIIATFTFLFLVFASIKVATGDAAALIIGCVGFCSVAFLSLTFNSTGFSMNAMRSFFSSIWYAIIPIPNKGDDKVDWGYQLIVNLVASSIGGVLAVVAIDVIF